MTTLEVGSHLITSRTGYTHHGIYVGDGLVIHYSGLANDLSAGPIELTSVESFASEKEIRLRVYDTPKYTGPAAVERAYSRLGENEYDLHANNCEHFCTWVITGHPSSRQIDAAEDVTDLLLSPILSSVLKVRKHAKQGFDSKEVGKDIADTTTHAAMVAAAVSVSPAVLATMGIAVPVVAPAVIAYKAIKWLFK